MHSHQPLDRPSSSLLYRLISRPDGDPDELSGPVNESGNDVTGSGSRTTHRRHAKMMSVLRRQIERDLLALFGTRRMSADTDLAPWPLVERSVLNYGIPDLSGTTGSSVDTRKLQRELSDAIKCFEPRLRPETLTVTCRVPESSADGVLVDVDGMFGPSDALESFAMGLSICLGNGQCRRREVRGAA